MLMGKRDFSCLFQSTATERKQVFTMDLADFSVSEAAAAIAKGKISSRELVQALVARNERFRNLNAFVSLDHDQVLNSGRRADEEKASGFPLGPLYGVPIALKDNINVAACVTTAGTPALRNYKPEKDAPVVSALRKSGAIVFGKNSMHELAYGATSNNPAFGTPQNPFDRNRSAGGSSGGSGAAVGARLVPASIGTDTGGSVRIPAALCGVWGYRPSTGRWPTEDIVPISTSRDTPGPLARSAEDLALLDSAVTGYEKPVLQPLKGLRIGISSHHFWENADEEVADICSRAVAALVSEGALLVEIDTRELLNHHVPSSMAISLYEGKAALTTFLKAHGIPLSFSDVVEQIASSDVREILLAQLDPARSVSRQAYVEATEIHRPALIAAYDRLFAEQRLDVIAFPVCRLPAPLLSRADFVEVGDVTLPMFSALIHNTDVGSNGGVPGLSVPVGLTGSGLPVGLGLDAGRGCDTHLLGIALTLGGLFPAPQPQLIYGS
ncbi:indoleacetamide hydrolase [Rhizobium bangladeshense]|uniref:indoleacetamide hydrolase n=1 Tax=Rhizobium bangladeshense TaxID=1138189 RepID=UPI001C82893B|nr:indoleacetamide hydrolase [Rhizobium bangladeshense]MBX4871019.1 indoleacetamide hydrolase [Rhizobium bangladeshense]MBX4871319.1 indoleacetamide hydrolase [Rhizobium bangladeshense]MBX4887583.1 indoleacetamide hydrolase [Rhizobium bangladeshense]